MSEELLTLSELGFLGDFHYLQKRAHISASISSNDKNSISNKKHRPFYHPELIKFQNQSLKSGKNYY